MEDAATADREGTAIRGQILVPPTQPVLRRSQEHSSGCGTSMNCAPNNALRSPLLWSRDGASGIIHSRGVKRMAHGLDQPADVVHLASRRPLLTSLHLPVAEIRVLVIPGNWNQPQRKSGEQQQRWCQLPWFESHTERGALAAVWINATLLAGCLACGKPQSPNLLCGARCVFVICILFLLAQGREARVSVLKLVWHAAVPQWSNDSHYFYRKQYCIGQKYSTRNKTREETDPDSHPENLSVRSHNAPCERKPYLWRVGRLGLGLRSVELCQGWICRLK